MNKHTATDNHNDPLISRITGELDADCEHLPPSVVRQLRDSREQALSSASGSVFSRFRLTGLLPLTSAATAAVLVVAVSLWYSTMRPPIPDTTAEDLVMLTANDSLDMYQDMEFYAWLAHHHETN